MLPFALGRPNERRGAGLFARFNNRTKLVKFRRIKMSDGPLFVGGEHYVFFQRNHKEFVWRVLKISRRRRKARRTTTNPNIKGRTYGERSVSGGFIGIYDEFFSTGPVSTRSN